MERKQLYKLTPDPYPGDTGVLDTTQFESPDSPAGFVNYDYIKLRHPGVQAETATYDATNPSDSIVLTITFRGWCQESDRSA